MMKKPLTSIVYEDFLKLICDVLLENNLTVDQEGILNESADELIEICNEHRCIPLFYTFYNQYQKKNIDFNKNLQKKFLANVVCQKKIESELFDVLAHLNKVNVQPVLLKGVALAYTVYDEAYLRPSVDIDIFIKKSDIAKAKTVFLNNDYYIARGWQPSAIVSQFTMCKPLANKLVCYFDVHEKISNDNRLSKIITSEDLEGAYVEKTVNGTNTRLINTQYAFIHACFHLLKHHHQGDLIRIIWVYDLGILLQVLNKTDMHELVALINNKKLNNVVLKTLELSLNYFKFTKIEDLVKEIDSLNVSPYDHILIPQKGLSRFITKIMHSDNILTTFSIFKETLLPPRAEIENKYGRKNRYILWLFYLRRIATGLVKWTKR